MTDDKKIEWAHRLGHALIKSVEILVINTGPLYKEVLDENGNPVYEKVYYDMDSSEYMFREMENNKMSVLSAQTEEIVECDSVGPYTLEPKYEEVLNEDGTVKTQEHTNTINRFDSKWLELWDQLSKDPAYNKMIGKE